ncbi:MAG: ABC transporter permease [Bacteroidota bacterium]
MSRFSVITSTALQALRAHPLHLFLSMLGLVIGVAALVAILSLGDGLEQYGRDQISTTTSLEALTVTPKTHEHVNGVWVRRPEVGRLTTTQADTLSAALAGRADLSLGRRTNVTLRLPDQADSLTRRLAGTLDLALPSAAAVLRLEPVAGRFFAAPDSSQPVVVLSMNLAADLAPDNPAALIGQGLNVGPHEAEIIGVVDGSSGPRLWGPYAAWNRRLPSPDPPTLFIRARQIEDVPALRTEVGTWLDTHTRAGSAGFDIATHQARVDQIQRGVRVFKLVMGFITGIAVLVGGIGVMNVLLISVTERTREIGIRKATGARKRDIVAQFLAESVTTTFTGSLLGLLVGLGTVAVGVPIIRHLTEAPFVASFSWGSLGIVVLVALVIGLGFGTYPAWRAARLAPVDAIRRE